LRQPDPARSFGTIVQAGRNDKAYAYDPLAQRTGYATLRMRF
jgi:hypothetical protein